MRSEMTRLGETAAKLRQAFDESFAAPPAQPTAPLEDVLVVGIGGDPYALRLAEAGGLHVDRTIVPVPSSVPELLGMSALRGQLTAIYSLGALLGYRGGSSPRWFVLTRGPKAVGLAFELLEAHARIPQASFATAANQMALEHVRGSVQLGGSIRPIIHIASVVEAIARRASEARRQQYGESNG